MLATRLAAATALLVLAGPATALAQSGAGDNQYSDPFGSSGGGSGQSTTPSHRSTPVHHSSGAGSNSSSGSSGSGSASPTVTAAPVTSPTPTPTPAPVSSTLGTAAASSATTSSGTATGSASSTSTLPRTGFDAGWEAAAGAVLLMAGLVLRAQTRLRRPRRRG